MARIAGVDIPKNKRGVIALTYIFGLGKSRAIEILDKAQVSQDKKVQEAVKEVDKSDISPMEEVSKVLASTNIPLVIGCFMFYFFHIISLLFFYF